MSNNETQKCVVVPRWQALPHSTPGARRLSARRAVSHIAVDWQDKETTHVQDFLGFSKQWRHTVASFDMISAHIVIALYLEQLGGK